MENFTNLLALSSRSHLTELKPKQDYQVLSAKKMAKPLQNMSKTRFRMILVLGVYLDHAVALHRLNGTDRIPSLFVC